MMLCRAAGSQGSQTLAPLTIFLVLGSKLVEVSEREGKRTACCDEALGNAIHQRIFRISHALFRLDLEQKLERKLMHVIISNMTSLLAVQGKPLCPLPSP